MFQELSEAGAYVNGSYIPTRPALLYWLPANPNTPSAAMAGSWMLSFSDDGEEARYTPLPPLSILDAPSTYTGHPSGIC